MHINMSFHKYIWLDVFGVRGSSSWFLSWNAFTVFLGTCFFFNQKLIITKLVSHKSTILHSDYLWLIICLMLEKMLWVSYGCIAIQGAPSPLWQSTLLMMPFIFLSPTTVIKAMQMNRRINAQFGLSSKCLPAFLTGNKTRVIESVWSESSAPSPSMTRVVWKLTSTVKDLGCLLTSTHAGKLLWLVSFLCIRLSWMVANSLSSDYINVFRLRVNPIKIGLLISFESS